MTWIALQLAAGGLLMAAGIRMARWSRGWTATASFLYYYGVRTTEQETAALCMTRGGGRGLAGTSDTGLLRGLRKKLAGRLREDVDRLGDLGVTGSTVTSGPVSAIERV